MSESIVFIVDDDAAVRDSLGLLCESAGWQVECHDSAESFLRAYRPEQPGCLVLDVRLEQMSGPELQAELNSRDSLLPIIFLTGHGDIPLTVHAIKAGAVDFLTKPIAGPELLESIEAALCESDQLQQRTQESQTAAARLASLTKREREVMTLAIQGLSNKEIAQQLGISFRTIEIHKARLMRKTGAKHLPDLIQLAQAAENHAA